MNSVKIDNKVREIVNWNEVETYLRMIELDIFRMREHKLDFTGNLKWTICKLEEIFSDAEDKATEILLTEEEE